VQAVTEAVPSKAVVVAVQLPATSETDFEASLVELERLATTLGLQPIARVVQRRAKLAPGVVLGEGKLKELATFTGGTGIVPTYAAPGSKKEVDEPEPEPEPDLPATSPKATVVLVDHDLTPTQHHNLSLATSATVLDRTSVILEIFHRHAKTREARLQVEIARLRYLAPRLRSQGGGDRVRGGIGGKGAGESALELDRRRIRDRIAELRRELDAIESGASTRRARRSELPSVALVGYTNAGKSSLMRALTGSPVLVADKLFATLDTTVRRLEPPTDPPILVTDTVGFIEKLPHDLVASFRSTLDEAGAADLLLHVVDASDPAHAHQLAVTHEVLADIIGKRDGVAPADSITSSAGGAGDSETWILLNKIDRVDAAGRAEFAARYPDAIQLSAIAPVDVAALHARIAARLCGALEDAELVVPWAAARAVADVHARASVVAESHDELGTRLHVRAPARTIAALRAAIEDAVVRAAT
jgi:GTP-binding protein HflX